MNKAYLFFIFIFIVASSIAQTNNDSLYSRLQAISNSGLDFYNVDGINITVQHLNIEFTKKAIRKKYKSYSIKEEDLTETDTTFWLPNFEVVKNDEIAPTVTAYTSYYFIEKEPNDVVAITFGNRTAVEKSFERSFINLVLYNKIPLKLFADANADSINFAGRNIRLGGACRWMGVANMQCPYNGQMNWSVHKNLAAAEADVEHQYQKIVHQKGGKVVAEEQVNVIFEGNKIKAKKVVYDIKGVNSLLVGMSGGKTLTIYFVAAAGKENYVACVMSHWNNDKLNASGLPNLIEEVMKLDK